MYNIFSCALNKIYNNKIRFIITIIMQIATFIVMEYSVLCYLEFRYSEWNAKSLIKYDFNDVYKIELSMKYAGAVGSESVNEIYYFYEELKDMAEIDCCGLYYTNYNKKIMYMSENLADLCGVVFEDFSIKEHNYDICKAVVGYDLLNFYNDDEIYFDDNQNINYAICAGIKHGSRFIDEDYINASGNVIDLDNIIVISLDDVLKIEKTAILNGLNNFYFVISKNYNNDRVLNKIENLAKKYKVDLYGVSSLKTHFKNNAKEAANDVGERYFMPLVMFFCSLVAVIISNVISFILDKKNIGILLANGMFRFECMLIYIVSDLIKLLIAYFCSVFYWFYQIMIQNNNLINNKIMKKSLFINSVVLLFYLFAVCMVSVYYMKNRMPIDLIGEVND